MIILSILNSPLWKSIDNKTRIIRVFFTGFIIYILFYLFLCSTYLHDYIVFTQYKNYLGFFLLVDFMYTLRELKNNKRKKKRLKLSKDKVIQSLHDKPNPALLHQKKADIKVPDTKGSNITNEGSSKYKEPQLIDPEEDTPELSIGIPEYEPTNDKVVPEVAVEDTEIDIPVYEE